jgi:hypothetical protein
LDQIAKKVILVGVPASQGRGESSPNVIRSLGRRNTKTKYSGKSSDEK